ncbi:MAG: DUF308 domain-containing protein [Sulfitobacter sp.]
MTVNLASESAFALGIRRNRGTMFSVGIAMIFAGGAAILFPLIGTLSVVWIVGVALIVASIAQSVAAFSYPKWSGIVLGLLVAALWLVAGLFLLLRPLEGVFALTVVVAAVFLIEGVLKTILSFQIRPLAGWGWLLFDGLFTVVLGGMLWWQLPLSALWALGTLAGISIMLSGWTLVMLPIALGKPTAVHSTVQHKA